MLIPIFLGKELRALLHGYGHLNTAKITLNRFKQDTLRWKQEVEQLIDATSIYIYPFGSSVLPEDRKYQFLVEEGFRIMCSVARFHTLYLNRTAS